MEKISGLVLEVMEKDCLVLGPGNEYVRVQMPDTPPLIGEMIEGNRLEPLPLSRRPVSRVWAYVASILITLMLGGYRVYAINAAPTDYVSIDINPSIELALNSKGKVIKAKSYNSEGAKLLKEANPEDKPLNQALQLLIPKALNKSNSSNSGSDTVIMTYTSSPNLQEENLKREVAEILEQQHFKGQLLSQPVDSKFRAKATDSQLSPGQQLIVDLAISNNVDLQAEDLKQSDMAKVLQNRNVQLNTLIEEAHKNSGKKDPELIRIGPSTLLPADNRRTENSALGKINSPRPDGPVQSNPAPSAMSAKHSLPKENPHAINQDAPPTIPQIFPTTALDKFPSTSDPSI